jgi:hypothetical protein
MKHTLIAFDTDTLPGKVRHTLMGPDYGYVHVMKTTDEGIDLSLPVNALAHLSKSPEQAVNDTKAVCQALGVALRKCLVFEVAETHS